MTDGCTCTIQGHLIISDGTQPAYCATCNGGRKPLPHLVPRDLDLAPSNTQPPNLDRIGQHKSR